MCSPAEISNACICVYVCFVFVLCTEEVSGAQLSMTITTNLTKSTIVKQEAQNAAEGETHACVAQRGAAHSAQYMDHEHLNFFLLSFGVAVLKRLVLLFALQCSILNFMSHKMQDEREDEAGVCMLCCHKRATITVCGECKEQYCAECNHTLVGITLFVGHMKSDMH